MPVVSNKEIIQLLKSQELIVHPLLCPTQISGARIDLRLDNVLYFIKRVEQPFYDPMEYIEPEKEPEVYVEERIKPYGDRIVLHPGDYALAPLFEFVKIPTNIIGRLDGRSSLGRLGVVVHSTAGSVDPGYSGPLVIELMNHGMLPVGLYPLMRVATIMFLHVTDHVEEYKGKYGRIAPHFGAQSKLHEDPDLNIIKRAKDHFYL